MLLLFEQVQCEFCPRTFPTENFLTYHLTHAHKQPKPCHICRMRFTTNGERKAHLKSEHSDLGIHKCGQCEATFTAYDSLKNHVVKIHVNPSVPIPCEVCGKLYNDKNAIRQHMKMSHPDPEQAVNCPTCGIQYKTAQHLKAHMLQVHCPTSFLCQLCGYSAKMKLSLDNHMKTVHSTARPHKCPHCPLTFKVPATLKEHVNRHFGKSLKSCPYCGVQKASGNLYNHISIIHKGRKFKCPQCPSMYSLRAHLKNHYVLKHPDLTIPPDADLEVVYTKNPEDTTTVVPPPAKKPRGPTGPRSTKTREGSSSSLSCSICPGAVFNTRDEFQLHTRRHEKDPDYKMKHRFSVQRLDQPSSQAQGMSENSPNETETGAVQLSPAHVASASDPDPMQPVSLQDTVTSTPVVTTQHLTEAQGQLHQPIPQYHPHSGLNTVNQQANPFPNPYQMDLLDYNAVAFPNYTHL